MNSKFSETSGHFKANWKKAYRERVNFKVLTERQSVNAQFANGHRVQKCENWEHHLGEGGEGSSNHPKARGAHWHKHFSEFQYFVGSFIGSNI